MRPNLINLTHSINGVRVTGRPVPGVRQGRPVFSVRLADGTRKTYDAATDVMVGGHTDRFEAGPVKALVGGQRIDYAERQAGFTVSRKPR